MSGIFKPVPARPVICAPALYAGNFARPALQSIALLLMIVIAMMAMVESAYAEGNVTRATSPLLWCGNEYDPATCIHSTKEAACVAMGAAYPNQNYNNNLQVSWSGGDFTGWSCIGNPAWDLNHQFWARLGWLAQLGACPSSSNSTSTGSCTCNTDYKPDPTATSCVPVAACPIPPFPEFSATDLCSLSLEKGAGKDVDLKCDPLDPEMVKQEACLADKIHRLGIPYTEPNATVRTEAYQQHFVDIWKWHKKIDKESPAWSDAEKQACAPTVAKVNAEMNTHKLRGAPSNSGSDAPHVQRKAVDIDEAVVDAIKAKVSDTTYITFIPPFCFFCMPIPVYIGDVQDYVNHPLVNPPPCKLRWGGRFKDKKGRPNPDPVHFDLFLQ